ncbi:hypothetical protein [Rubrivirga marina]|uniref:hypothetical protein n=1 Tax=Rubrivirga marina TaxID=1196024 RepID=UPI00117B453F|nr:hypothetical protein [Rubrivirga marina]
MTAPLLVQSPFATVDLDGSVLGLEPDGGLFGGRALGYHPTDFSPFSASRSGVWLGGTQDGMTRSSIVYWESNFTTDCGDGPTGVFALDADTTYTDTEAWPRDLGAPTEADGSPRVYGDQMLWGSFCSEANPFAGGEGQWAGRYADPLRGLRMNVAAYRYRRADLAGAVFVRYEVTNEGSAPISDLRVGTFSDTESPGPYENVGYAAYGKDAVGFDSATGLSYVYQLPFTDDDGITNSSTWVSGTTFLDLPLLSHRILRRYTWQDPEGFGQGPASATEAVRALDGLSYAGDPMIDPTTGQPSRFAFDDDPFGQTGWLDGRDEDGVFVGADVRQLLSAGPVALGAGETLAFTVVWVTADAGPTSFDSYRAVQRLLSTVRAERSLWDFTSTGT